MWVRLALIVGLLLFLLVIKANLSLSILLPGILLAILFRMNARGIIISVYHSLTSFSTIRLLLIIYLVLLLVEIQKTKGSLRKLVRGMEGLFGNKWLTITLSPALIGLLPMPGGALVSAPTLDEALPKGKVKPELKTFINYWFRHIWEFFWPLYQGFIVTVAIFGIRTVELMKNQFYFMIIAVALGYISMAIFLPSVGNNLPKENPGKSLLILAKGTWEILAIVVFILIFNVDLLLSLLIVTIFSFLISVPLNKKFRILLKAFNVNILLLIASVMIFKGFVLNSSLSQLLKGNISGSKTLLPVLMVSIPFSLGFLTGVNTAFAGIAFPLFVSIVGQNINYISLLYISGFSGVLLSPLHLCLVLSAEYYGAKLFKVYKYITVPVLVILFLAIIIFA